MIHIEFRGMGYLLARRGGRRAITSALSCARPFSRALSASSDGGRMKMPSPGQAARAPARRPASRFPAGIAPGAHFPVDPLL